MFLAANSSLQIHKGRGHLSAMQCLSLRMALACGETLVAVSGI